MAIKVDYVVFSLNAYNKHNVNSLMGFNIESLLNHLTLISIPGTFSFFTSINFRGEFEVNREYLFEFNMKYNDNIVFESGKLPFLISDRDIDKRIPENLQTKFISFQISDLLFMNHGVHSYEIIVDGELLKLNELYVFPIQNELTFWRGEHE